MERFRDELGDWRLCLLTPFGGRVHAPWALAVEARIGERLGMEVQTIWSDDGIAIRLPEGDAPLDGIEDLLFPDPDDLEDLVVGRLASSTLFASRFRENAARALLLPRRRPGTRTPLWQQRQRAADLLAVASRYGSFPILVETYRECLSDVFDLPALREILAGVARRDIVIHSVETARASPFAGSLLFDYVAAYMYDGDTPLAERRAGALTLDRDLLRELLGQEELRELLDPDALADLELSLQALVEDRRATTLDGVHDLLRRLGDLAAAEVSARTDGGAAVAEPWLAELAAARRAVRTRIAGDDRWIAIEDVARYRDGVGIAPPVGVPGAFLAPVAGALDGLLARWARTHGPFLTPDPARRWGLPQGNVEDALERLQAAGSLLHGEFRPGGAEREWCDPEVLRLLRRRSLARLRREVEPVDPAALARFLPDWHGVAAVGASAAPHRGSAALERLAEVVDQLAGLAIPASVLERDVLPARIPGYLPRLLDELGSLGEIAWVGRGVKSCARLACRMARNARAGRAMTRSAIIWRVAAHRSIASCSRRPVADPTERSWTRCGTSSGRRRSPMTPSRLSVRCAGSEPEVAAPAGPSGPAGSRPSDLPRQPGAGRWSPRRPRSPRQPSDCTPSASPCSNGMGS